MVHFLGRDWTRQDLLAHVGDMSQISGIRASEMTDGQARGCRLLHLYDCSGLSFEVLPDRALDIGRVAYNGIPLTWMSSTGYVHPSYYETDGLGWLRSFQGGLMTTCGLDQFGSPSVDNGESFGIHGRISNLPSEQVSYNADFDGDAYVLTITGKVKQSRLFGENLHLERKITVEAGQPEICVVDRVINMGFKPQPHMILYHCNFGFPLINDQTVLEIDAEETIPRDSVAKKGLDSWRRFQSPTLHYEEQVFRHRVRAMSVASQGAEIKLVNHSMKLGVRIQYDNNALPHLFQWKQMGRGAYVLGLEPANSSAIEGRSVARLRDDLPILEPGEMRDYSLMFTIEEL